MAAIAGALLVGQIETLIILGESANDIKQQDSKPVHLSVLSELKSELAPSTNIRNIKKIQFEFVKLLDQINDLFGELTIARNGINL